MQKMEHIRWLKRSKITRTGANNAKWELRSFL